MIRVREREFDAMETRCVCGAVGRALLPDVGRDAGDGRVSLLEWVGGNIGAGRTALEEPSPGVVRCPACQHRACVYIVARVSGSRGGW
jgi:hypothetical protein